MAVILIGCLTLGGAWGVLIDSLLTFSSWSITVEVIGAALIGYLLTFFTRNWWSRPWSLEK